MEAPSNIYMEKGYKNRTHYLLFLAEQYGKTLYEIQMLASMFGPDEDFDGLVCALDEEFNSRDCFPIHLSF